MTALSAEFEVLRMNNSVANKEAMVGINKGREVPIMVCR